MGVVLQFPGYNAERRFTTEMRQTILRFAARTPGAFPTAFDLDDDGAEVCRLANGLVIGWNRWHRLVLIDTVSGFVDRGPFRGVDEICSLIAYLAA
jgi:hypothetical protein